MTLVLNLINAKVNAQYLAPGDDIQYTCIDNYSLILQNVTPDYDIPSSASVGLNAPQYTYDPNTGQLDFSIGSLTGPKSYGIFIFDLYQFGVMVDQITILILDCCLQGISYDHLILDGTYSDFYPNGIATGETFLVLDDLLLDVNSTISSCTFYMANEAKISLPNGHLANIAATKITKACEYCWDGIYADGLDTRITFNESELSGACNGFQLKNSVSFESLESDYLNNQLSIRGEAYHYTGDFVGDSRWHLWGNTFNSQANGISVVEPHPLSTAFIPPNPLSCQSCVVGIELFEVSEFIQIGQEARNQNLFTGLDLVAIHLNVANVALENNEFETTSSAIQANGCLLENGGSAAKENRFLFSGNHAIPKPPLGYTLGSGLGIINSSINLQHNKFEFNTLKITDPTDYTVKTTNGTVVSNNTFFESAGNFSGDITPWVVVDVEFRFNNLDNCHFSFKNFKTTNVNNGVRIESNDFKSNTLNDPRVYRLSSINNPGIRIGDNDFYTALTSPNYTYGDPCIYIEDSPDGEIKGNGFFDAEYGIYAKHNIAGTRISCNIFASKRPLYLYHTIITDNFGSSVNDAVENQWNLGSAGTSWYNIQYEQPLPTSPYFVSSFDYFTLRIPDTIISPTNVSIPVHSDPELPGSAGIYPVPIPGQAPIIDVITATFIGNSFCALTKMGVTGTPEPTPLLTTPPFVFPNPTKHVFSVDLGNAVLNDIQLYNALGQPCTLISLAPNTYQLAEPVNGLYVLIIRLTDGLTKHVKLQVSE